MEAFIAQFGLIAVYIGAALEGDASVMAGGMLFVKGHLPLWPVILVAALGGWSSDLTVFALTRRHADRAWVAKALAAMRRSRLLCLFRSRPVILALAFRFIPGARTIGPVALASSNDLRFAHYAALTAFANLTWATVLVLFGGTITHVVEIASGELRLHAHLAIWVAAIAASLVAGWALRRHWMR